MGEYFLDPVMDQERLTCHYASLPALLSSLKKQGVRNINAARNQGLTGKQAMQKFNEAYSTLTTSDGQYPLSYEVVYGHAWKGDKRRILQGEETFIPVSQIGRVK
jgi:malonyl-CoA O-methyltransferase